MHSSRVSACTLYRMVTVAVWRAGLTAGLERAYTEGPAGLAGPSSCGALSGYQGASLKSTSVLRFGR